MTVGITELPPEGMLLPGVALAGDAERGTKTTEGISLLFTAAGVTVQGPQPQIERLLVWSALDSAACREVVQLPDGRDAAIMELTSGGQSIRFLLPTDAVSPGQAAYLDQALPTWLARYRGLPAPVAPATVAAVATQPAAEAPVGVELPAPGPTAAPAESPEQAPAPSFATAGIAAGAGATGFTPDQPTMSPSNGSGPASVAPPAAPAQYAAPPAAPPAPAPEQFAAPPAPPAPPAPAPEQFAAPPAPPAPPAPAPEQYAAPPAAAPQQYAAPPLAAPQQYAAPPAPAPQQYAAPPAPAPEQFAAPPAAPQQYAAPPAPQSPASMQAPMAEAPAMTPVPGTSWDDPPLGGTFAEPTEAKKASWYKLAPRKPKASKAPADVAPAAAPAAPAAPAPVAVAGAVIEPPAPKKAAWYKLAPSKSKATTAAAVGAADLAVPAPSPAVPSVGDVPVTSEAQTVAQLQGLSGEVQAPTKKPFFTLTRRKAATAAGAGAAAVAATTAPVAPVFDGVPTATPLPPTAPTGNPVPLAVQPPAPGQGATPYPPTTSPIVPGGDPADFPAGAGGASDVTLADGGSKSNRRAMVLLIVLLVVAVIAGGIYYVSKKNNSTTAPPAVPSQVPSTATDTALAGVVNLHLGDLPTGWTQAAPAQAIVRPPVAPVAAQAAAAGTMASCLSTSVAVVTGLFGSGFLPGQTGLVQSPTFQSAAGSSFEMASRTSTLATTAQVQSLEAVVSNPKFTGCYQQYVGAVASAAVHGATVAVVPVALTGPTGTQTVGVVSTYTLPGSGTEVVGDAYIMGGRVVTTLQPTTSGASIPGSVFTPAYTAVASRVAAASKR